MAFLTGVKAQIHVGSQPHFPHASYLSYHTFPLRLSPPRTSHITPSPSGYPRLLLLPPLHDQVYAAGLRAKTATFKELKEELAALRGEGEELARTEASLRSRAGDLELQVRPAGGDVHKMPLPDIWRAACVAITTVHDIDWIEGRSMCSSSYDGRGTHATLVSRSRVFLRLFPLFFPYVLACPSFTSPPRSSAARRGRACQATPTSRQTCSACPL